MSTVTNAAGYLENLVQSWRRPPAASLFWLDQLRAHAMNSVGTLRMPTTHDEEWRFTDISPLGRLPYPVARAAPKTQFSDISHYYLVNLHPISQMLPIRQMLLLAIYPHSLLLTGTQLLAILAN